MSDSSITIYHNPRCSKSRRTLELIRAAGTEPIVVEYLKNPPSSGELDELLGKLDLEPLELMRQKEAIFREMDLADKDLARGEAIDLMAENPVLIERPIVVRGCKAIIGRPPENVQELL